MNKLLYSLSQSIDTRHTVTPGIRRLMRGVMPRMSGHENAATPGHRLML